MQIGDPSMPSAEETTRDHSELTSKRKWRIVWLVVAGILLLGIVSFLLWILRQVFFLVDVSSLLRVPSWAVAFVKQSIAIGVLTMAVIQMVRMTYPVRGIFHGRRVRAWLRAGIVPEARSNNKSEVSSPQRDPVAGAVSELLKLAVTSDSRALFDLSIEQLCGQMAAAIDPVLDAPTEQRELLGGLAGESGMDDVNRYVTAWENWRDRLKGSKSQSSGGNMQRLSEPSKGNSQATSEPSEIDIKFLDARNAVSRRIHRNIDGFQILVSTNWKRMLRIGAVIIAGVLSCYGTAEITDVRSRLFFVFAGGIMGGFIATVARDIVAGIEKLRR